MNSFKQNAEKNCICLFISVLLIPFNALSQSVTFTDSDPNIIVISNGTEYEIALLKSNGAILYIKDLENGQRISEGSADSCLWVAMNADYWQSRSSDFGPGPDTCTYNWDDQLSTLTINYTTSNDNYEGAIGTVILKVTEGAWFDMQMTVENCWQLPLMSLSFPHNLKFNKEKINQALVPITYPGIMLEKNYFSLETNYIDVYPGTFHTDFLGFGFEEGLLCMYTLRKGQPVRSIKLGVQYLESGYHSAVHDYNQLWIENDNLWSSPITRIWVGESFINTLKECRKDNEMDLTPSLSEKLGERFMEFTKSPVYCYTIGESVHKPFNQIAEWAEQHPSPNITMISSYYSGGFHGHHPDYLPPNPEWGTTEDFQKMVNDLKQQGKWVMPFILPNWWHEESPTLQNLNGVTIKDIAEININNEPVHKYWGEDPGYFVSPNSPFVKNRLQKIYEDIFETYGCDMIYEDVIGFHPAGLDFNANLPTPMDLIEEWLNHFESYKDYHRSVEGGTDLMLKYSFGFMGTVKGGSPLGPEGYEAFELGSQIWRPYPTAPFLYHDKVVPMQFWGPLYKDLLSWNLLYGCQLNIWIDDGVPERASDSPWIPVMHDFQRHVVSRLTGKKMTDYSDLTEVVSQSNFEDMQVIYNWDENNTYQFEEHTISSQGAMVTSAGGDLMAGIFTKYNNENLSVGDHYLIVENHQDSIIVRHPMGSDTPITIKRPTKWIDPSRIQIYAHLNTGSEDINPTINENYIHFNLEQKVSEQIVSHYSIQYDTSSVFVSDDLIKHGQASLHQNFPNPFNTETTIRYEIPKLEHVELKIYNIYGQEIRSILDEIQPAGKYTIVWSTKNNSGMDVSPGIYFLQMKAGTQLRRRKMLFMK